MLKFNYWVVKCNVWCNNWRFSRKYLWVWTNKKIKPVYTTKIIENNVFYSTEYGIDDKLIKEVDKRLPNQFVYILKTARFK